MSNMGTWLVFSNYNKQTLRNAMSNTGTWLVTIANKH